MGGTTRLLGNWDHRRALDDGSETRQHRGLIGQEADGQQADGQRRYGRKPETSLWHRSDQGVPVRFRKMSTVERAERRCNSDCNSSNASFDRVRNAYEMTVVSPLRDRVSTRPRRSLEGQQVGYVLRCDRVVVRGQ